MRAYSIVVLRLLHLFVMLFMVLGWMLPGADFLKIHVATVPLVILQWRFNGGTCLLTNIENIIADKRREKSEQQGEFIKAVLSQCMKDLPSDSQLKIGIYTVLFVSAGASALRLLMGWS